MEQQAAWSVGKPGLEDDLLGSQADSAAYFGRLGEARDLSRRAMDSANGADSKEATATYSARSV